MAITFVDPGTDDTHDLSRYSDTQLSVSSATDQAHTGGRSVKCSTGSPAVTSFAQKRTVLADTGSRVSWWYRFDSLPSANSNIFATEDSAISLSPFQIQLRTTGVLSLVIPSVGTTNGTTVLSANTWYRICVSYYITNTTTFRFRVYINGASEIDVSAGTLTVTGTSAVRFVMNSGFGINKNSWYDDIYVDDGASSSSQPDTGDIYRWILPAVLHARRQRA